MKNGQQNKHLSWFKVENFKRFEAFEMENIGQFNLIFGDNNTGKTTVLEALLFDDENFNQFLYNLTATLPIRGFELIDDKINPIHIKTFFNIKNDKHTAGFISTPIHIATKKTRVDMRLEAIENLSDQSFSKLTNNITLTPPPREILVFENGKGDVPMSMRFNENKAAFDVYVPFIPFNKAYEDDLIQFLRPIQESRKLKKRLNEAMSLLIPDIDDIEVSVLYSKTPKVIVWLKSADSPMPLPAFGDGAVRLFRFFVEIPQNKHRRLMIDEIDAGIHYSRAKDFWKKILVEAKENDVQIFATTHNKEGLKYFYEALEELPEYQQDARCFTLSQIKDESIKSYTQTYEQFEHALLHDIEIRGRQ